MTGREDLTRSGRVKLTYDDFLLFPDDGTRHELIDGEHHVSPSPNVRHQQIAGNLHWLIRSYLETARVGRVFVAPLDVKFSWFDVVAPDLLYVSKERGRKILTGAHVDGVPELVVEIASPGTRARDETSKRRLYERAGVSEYWLVDPEIEQVRVYRNRGAGFEPPTDLARERGEVLRTSLLPGLDLALSRIFDPSM